MDDPRLTSPPPASRAHRAAWDRFLEPGPPRLRPPAWLARRTGSEPSRSDRPSGGSGGSGVLEVQGSRVSRNVGTGTRVAMSLLVVLLVAGAAWWAGRRSSAVEGGAMARVAAAGDGTDPDTGLVPAGGVRAPSTSTGVGGGIETGRAETGGTETVGTDTIGTETGGTTGAARVMAHAAGAVSRPGLYELDDGARVRDLLAAAGGPTADADLDRVNLAAPVVDGVRVYIPRLGSSETPAVVVPDGGSRPPTEPGATPSATAPRGPVSINTASAPELESLPGIGPATAAAIIAHRTQHGPFRTIDALAEVRGIGPAKLAQLRDAVSL